MSDREAGAAPVAAPAADAVLDVAVERVLRRDRIVTIGALGVVCVSAWIYLLMGAGMGMSALEMTRMSGQSMPLTAPMGDMDSMMSASWSLVHAAIMFAMWWIMMVAMMLPSAAPMILLFAAINRRQKERGNTSVSTALFTGAYLVVWAGFSLVAVMLQWLLQSMGWLTPMLVSSSTTLNALLLLLAGAYQLTPVKQACLRHCRSPIAFLSSHWRAGRRGAFDMGVRHGLYCVGCCWFLMGLLFFGGVMNLWWIVGLALFVLLEKTLPIGHWLAHATGVCLLGAGLVLLLAGG